MHAKFRKVNSITFAGLLFTASFFAYAAIICKVDNTPITYTGDSKLGNNGSLVWEHKCVMGHVYWLDSVVN